MGRTLASILAVLAFAIVNAPVASAQELVPRSAAAFQNSVGVATHIVYFDTSYGDWPRIVAALDELGVRHVRDGVYAAPAPQWHDWNERYYAAVELAAANGIRFDFGMGQPGFTAGTLSQLVDVVATRLRGAVEALEDPNEFDYFGGTREWPSALASYDRQLYQKVKSDPSLRSLPVIGPSFAGPESPGLLGDQHEWLDIGNIHPYTGGQSPAPAHTESELRRAEVTAGSKPVWATEAGFNNALGAPPSSSDQPPVSERAGAIYTLRTLLEHFASGIARTYLYELIDEKPDPPGKDSQQHYGLLRSDFSAKPAYIALRNLLRLVGRGTPPGGLHPISLKLSGDVSQVEQLVLQRDDGTYVVALWSLGSVWSTTSRHALPAGAHAVILSLPAGARAEIADPILATTTTPLRLRGEKAHLMVRGDPLIVLVKSRPLRSHQG